MEEDASRTEKVKLFPFSVKLKKFRWRAMHKERILYNDINIKNLIWVYVIRRTCKYANIVLIWKLYNPMMCVPHPHVWKWAYLYAYVYISISLKGHDENRRRLGGSGGLEGWAIPSKAFIQSFNRDKSNSKMD